ncbi:hypothetical protein FB446DRAFT_795320 [Lentinula raphanica]|nr:hypothetical protein FB446DRAFT_795320 [Lentinula raphanica]
MPKTTSKDSTSDHKARGPNVRWTDEDDKVIVQTLLDHKGHQSDSGWKSSVWPLVVDALKAQGLDNGPSCKTASKVPDRYSSLKQSYSEVKALREMSGFGWDDIEKKVVATEEVWDNLLNVKGTSQDWEMSFTQSQIHVNANASSCSSVPPSQPLTTLAPSKHSRSRPTGTHAMLAMTGALHDIANGISDTPRRQRIAVQMLQDDGDMSEEETIDAMCFLTDNTNVVNTFIGIKDKEQRTKFLRRMMERATR